MIKKLKKKFILINMILITIVLLITFISILGYTNQQIINDYNNIMKQVIDKDGRNEPPKREIGGMIPMDGKNIQQFPFATFYVKLDSSNNIIEVIGDDFIISDESVLNEIVKGSMNSIDKSGVVQGEDLRFLKQKTPFGLRIVFADRSYELSTLSHLVQTAAFVGIGTLLAFFLISLFLANWVLKPIEKSWEQQKQFVADASHELKTPLTVILANAGIILSHKDDKVENQLKWLEYIQTEAQRMTTLVNNLLFLAKTDDAKNNEIYSEVNFSDVLWSSMLPFESVIFEQEKFLDSNIEPDIFVRGDESKLKQLIVILIDNACKYSDKNGRIKVELTQKQDKVKLTVNNTGEIITKDQIDNIFVRFYRVDKSRAREKGGYGLGLAIAESIVKSHNGKISVESTEETGTTFAAVFQTVKKRLI